MAKTKQATKLGGFSKDIYKVLDAYEHALLARFPRTRYLVGYDARFVWMNVQWMPEWLGDFIMGIFFKAV